MKLNKKTVARLTKNPFLLSVTTLASGTLIAQIINLLFIPLITRMKVPDASVVTLNFAHRFPYPLVCAVLSVSHCITTIRKGSHLHCTVISENSVDNDRINRSNHIHIDSYRLIHLTH